ncbi:MULTISPECIES: hypothetical protein [unclassified Nocardia]|uniref:YqeB family protein n=1 Tax=unclassified Nocardia TaxID=2637762 RepID=UPI001CE4098F|nr:MULTISPECIES: hypothetical protein [unclassified Nocardia]
MTTSTAPTTLRLPRVWAWVFTSAGLVLGIGVGAVLPPVGHWLVDTVQIAPGWLHLVLTVPPVWLMPIGAAVGLIGGLVVAGIAHEESLVLTVSPVHVELSQNGRERFVPRDRVAAVFREDDDLVLVDRNRMRLARFGAGDLGRRDVETAFRLHGYPWVSENDPYATEFTRWMDGRPEIDDAAHCLLRARRRAIADKKPLEVEALDEKLAEHGVDVRDRKGVQQIRLIADRP